MLRRISKIINRYYNLNYTIYTLYTVKQKIYISICIYVYIQTHTLAVEFHSDPERVMGIKYTFPSEILLCKTPGVKRE